MPTIYDEIEKEIEKADQRGLKVTKTDGVIEEALDDCLRVAREEKASGGNEYVNVLFIGAGGSGKTSRIKAWAKAHGINLKEVHTADLDQTDMGGAVAPNKAGTKVTRLSPTEMDSLDKPNSVLFLDEYNRGADTIRGTLLTLIENLPVYDAEAPGFRRELEGMLFTVAAINPYSPEYNTQLLDAAEESRFMTIFVGSSPEMTFEYLRDKYSKRKAPGDEGRIKLAETILLSPRFSFDTAEEEAKTLESGNRKPLSARTFTRLLQTCHGTKESLLKKWDAFCDTFKKPMVESILANYQDADNKANDLLKNRQTESEVFKKKSSMVDQLKDLARG